MALNFPSSPSVNATYTFNGKTWTYTGNAWALSTSSLNTGVVSEGTNLYFTNARARTAISVTGSGSYDNTTGVITITGGVSSVNGQTGATTGFATTANSLSQFASTTSSELATLISDETGTGSLVFAASPVLSGTVSIGGTANIMSSVTNTTSQIKVSPATGANANSKISLWGTFFNYPSDTQPRLIATVKSGFSTGVWGTEYLDILVNNGGSNDTSTEALQNRVVRVTKGNVDVTGNITASNIRLLTNGILTFADGTTQTTAASVSGTLLNIITRSANVGIVLQNRTFSVQGRSANTTITIS